MFLSPMFLPVTGRYSHLSTEQRFHHIFGIIDVAAFLFFTVLLMQCHSSRVSDGQCSRHAG